MHSNIVDTKEAVETILNMYGACYQRELVDRARSLFGNRTSSLLYSLKELKERGLIDCREVEGPYSRPFIFYFKSNLVPSKRDAIIQYKVKLMRRHSILTDEIGDCGQDLIASILKIKGYSDVKTDKKKHNGIGLNRRELDVFGKHPIGYYQHIEVKNRKQELNDNDVIDVIEKTELASERWSLPVKSAIVCNLINSEALDIAKSEKIPVLITKKQYVPIIYSSFYEEYRETLGSYYVEIVDCSNPPEWLVKNFEEYIFNHNYD